MRLKSAHAALVVLALASTACKTTGSDSEVKDFPPGAVGLPAQLPAVFILEGAAAKSVYDRLSLDEEVDTYGANKTFYGHASLYCERSGGGLPPGAQGFPAPATFRCGMGAMIPPGAQGFPPPPFLKLDGTAARELFNAMEVPEDDQGSSSSKSFQGSVAFYCGYTLENGIRSNDYCRMTADDADGGIPPGAQGLPNFGGGDDGDGGIPPGAQGLPAMPDDGYDGGIPPGAQGLPNFGGDQ